MVVNECDEQAGPGLSYCFGYILGVADMHNALNAVLSSPKDNTYCLPDNASISQLAKVVTKYGHEHPGGTEPGCAAPSKQRKQRIYPRRHCK